jgi:ParB family transcriptional regulator, chromosome partitioning protein
MTSNTTETRRKVSRRRKSATEVAVPQDADTSAGKPTDIEQRIVYLKVSQVEPNPFQPRSEFKRADMTKLIESVREHGVLQPITVRTKASNRAGSNGHRKDDGDAATGGSNNGNADNGEQASVPVFQLVAGERRLRASKTAGKETIPAIIRDDLTDEQAAELAIVENLQRSDLNVMEEAAGYAQLMREFSLKEERIAQRVGRSTQAVKNTLKLLHLPEPVQQLIADGSLTQSHGLVLVRYSGFPELCAALASYCVEQQVPASYLEQGIPDAYQFEQEGLLVRLSQYSTRFDISTTCTKCPFKAFLQQGHQLLCLRPDEWLKKQELAIQQEQNEAAQVLEEARAQDSSVVNVAELPITAYREVSYGAPEGCDERCPCRGKALLHGSLVPVCIDMGRYKKLEREQNKRRKDALRARLNALVKEAQEVIDEEQGSGKWQRVALALSYPLLMTAGKPVVQQAAKETGIFLDFEKLFGYQTQDREKMKMLAELDSGKLLAFAARVLVAKEAKESLEWRGGSTLYMAALLNRLDPPQQELATADNASETVADQAPARGLSVETDGRASPTETEVPEATHVEDEANRNWTAGDAEEAGWFDGNSSEEDPFSDGTAEPDGDEDADGVNWEDPWHAEDADGLETDAPAQSEAEVLAEDSQPEEPCREGPSGTPPSGDATGEPMA